MTLEVRPISLGALSAHPLRGEKGEKRPGHLTTSLIVQDDVRILIDPSLPPRVLAERLDERAGVSPDAIDMVFLTSFRPIGRRGLPLFPDARWLIAEPEREAIGVGLIQEYERASDASDESLMETLRDEISLLQRCESAPDTLTEGVDLFPLNGLTPGFCGLLLADPKWTMVIAGDAVPTVEHLVAGQVLAEAHDLKAAQASLGEVVEIADFIVPGRDGLTPNPIRRW